MQLKSRRWFWKTEGEWTVKVEIRTRKKFLAVVKACMAIIWAAPGFKGRIFVSSGFSTEVTLSPVSAVPQWHLQCFVKVFAYKLPISFHTDDQENYLARVWMMTLHADPQAFMCFRYVTTLASSPSSSSRASQLSTRSIHCPSSVRRVNPSPLNCLCDSNKSATLCQQSSLWTPISTWWGSGSCGCPTAPWALGMREMLLSLRVSWVRLSSPL